MIYLKFHLKDVIWLKIQLLIYFIAFSKATMLHHKTMTDCYRGKYWKESWKRPHEKKIIAVINLNLRL